MNSEPKEILKRALTREREARKQAEGILELKSKELYDTAEELKEVNIKLENLLSEKSAELKGVFENIIDGFVLIDLNGNVLKLNEAAVQLFGYDIDKEHLNVTNLIYVEDYDYAMNSFYELIEKGYFKNYQARVITKSNEVKWVHINASILYDKSDRPIAAQGIVRDITEEREQHLIIEVLNDLARSILGKMNIYDIAWEIVKNIADYLKTDDCVIFLVDHEENTLEQIAVYGKKNLGFKQIADPLTISIGNGIVGSVVRSAKAEIVHDTRTDKRYIKDDANRLSEIVVPIMNNGKVIAVIDSEHPDVHYFTKEHLQTLTRVADLVALQLKSAINIRDRKRAERINAELLQKLERSNQELQEYAHVVSHDLKSPLRSINALVSWIKEDNTAAFDEASLKNFELIDTTLEKMELLITDVLFYASIDSQNQKKSEVNLNTLLADLKNTMYIPQHIELVVPKELPTVLGDYVKFQQLFQNLIGNAVKFIDKEKGLVEIMAEEKNTHYKFSVIDNGPGIDEKDHKRIFKLFHSLDTKNQASSGIGLSIVKKIINSYKGEIWVDSTIGTGTKFCFTIKK